MKTFWENNGQPDANGQIAAVIDLEDGSSGIQRFIGSSEKEVADKLLTAQGNASAKIREQQRQILQNATPDPAQPASEFRKRSLTADERFQVANSITDPAKAPEAIRTVVEAEVGASLEQVRERMASEEEDRRVKEAHDESVAFASETEDFQPCQHNAETLARYMQMNGWAPTKKNFGIAWERLKAAGLVVLKQPATATSPEGGLPSQPDESQPDNGGLPAQPAVTTRPRGTVSSTGIRSGDSTGTPAPRTATPKYTRQQIEAMSQTEYKFKLLNEAGFAKFVDSLNGQ